jgi:acyl-CoA reductase-like NAD-dependent aldehyde dehydrogenase
VTQTIEARTTGERAESTPTYGNFIGGEWRPAESGRNFESRNPADTRDLIATFAASDAADAAAAIRAAEDALPGWRRTPAPKRGEIMYAFAALLAQHKERLARAMTREMGKVLAEARGDVQEGVDIAYLMAGEGRRMFGDTTPSELPNKWAMSVREPIGVAGIITPWNFPIAIPCWKMMPALISGNTVVFKPASDTPHCAALLVELLAEAAQPRAGRQERHRGDVRRRPRPRRRGHHLVGLRHHRPALHRVQSAGGA